MLLKKLQECLSNVWNQPGQVIEEKSMLRIFSRFIMVVVFLNIDDAALDENIRSLGKQILIEIYLLAHPFHIGFIGRQFVGCFDPGGKQCPGNGLVPLPDVRFRVIRGRGTRVDASQ
jgi:hypothetical protein